MDEQRRAKTAQDRGGLARPLRRVRRDAHVERLALPDGGIERAHRLFEGSVRIEPVGIEDVDVVETHPAEALIEAGQEVLARSPDAIGSWPHVVAGLGRDDQLVPMAPEVRPEDAPEVRLCGPGRRAVVVAEVEMGHAAIECPQHDGALGVERTVVAEVLPQAKGDRGQQKTTRADPPIGHRVVPIRGGTVRRRHAQQAIRRPTSTIASLDVAPSVRASRIVLYAMALPTGPAVSFLFTDIEGSTRLERAAGSAAWAALVARHDDLLRASIERHGGVVVKTEGDAFFAAFDSPTSAVAAAVDAQRAIAAEAWPDDLAIRVRMGIHLGEGRLRGARANVDDDYVGIDVNYTARITATANGGQIVVSGRRRRRHGRGAGADRGPRRRRARRRWAALGQGLRRPGTALPAGRPGRRRRPAPAPDARRPLEPAR